VILIDGTRIIAVADVVRYPCLLTQDNSIFAASS
jgi:hypothetical protein